MKKEYRLILLAVLVKKTQQEELLIDNLLKNKHLDLVLHLGVIIILLALGMIILLFLLTDLFYTLTFIIEKPV